MESPMGYRNSQIVEELAAEGKITTEHKGVQTFDFAQYSLLKRMAETTADWPLDKAAEEKHMLPRTFTSGWLSIAIGWGMTIPQTIDEIVDIGNEPRNPKREQLAYNRLGKIAKKLESAGLIKCLRNGNVQRKNNAVWLLMLGDDEENADVEAYVRERMRLCPVAHAHRTGRIPARRIHLRRRGIQHGGRTRGNVTSAQGLPDAT